MRIHHLDTRYSEGHKPFIVAVNQEKADTGNGSHTEQHEGAKCSVNYRWLLPLNGIGFLTAMQLSHENQDMHVPLTYCILLAMPCLKCSLHSEVHDAKRSSRGFCSTRRTND